MASLVMEESSPSDLSSVVDLLDRVFVTPQQRIPSFWTRYPSLRFLGDNDRLWVAKQGTRIAGCLLVKQRTYKGFISRELAMVGAVCTDPQMRGQKIASQLLQHAEMTARASGLATMVLWTTIIPFYEQLGWNANDPGLLGELQDCSLSATDNCSIVCESPKALAQRIERIRSEWVKEGIVRTENDYGAIPFPAEAVDGLIASEKSDQAYALVGRKGQVGYVYEVIGAATAFAPLWANILARYRSVYINECSGSSTMQWLDANLPVKWQPRPLAMWKGEWRGYVPYFDRV